MRIGEVSQATQVPIKTLRYYEEIGVLSPPNRTQDGYRDYSEEALNQIRFIKASQSVGLSLREIGEILAYRTGSAVPCQRVLALLQQRAGEYQEKIAELSNALATLCELINRAEELNVEDCLPDNVCHLIPLQLAATSSNSLPHSSMTSFPTYSHSATQPQVPQ